MQKIVFSVSPGEPEFALVIGDRKAYARAGAAEWNTLRQQGSNRPVSLVHVDGGVLDLDEIGTASTRSASSGGTPTCQLVGRRAELSYWAVLVGRSETTAVRAGEVPWVRAS